MNSFTINKLYSRLRQISDANEFWVAYSGGVDSHVLLHSLASLRKNHPELKITAIHINHSLSKNAASWNEHCRKICLPLKIDFVSRTIDVKAAHKKKQSLEAVARKLRYLVFAETLPQHAVLLTAHHADDQAETVLLQLLRGCGVKGLAGIAVKNTLGKGYLVRPLLQFARADLVIYAKQHRLKWREDESNLNLKISRNYVRHKLLPLIAKHWLGAHKTLAQAAQNAIDANELLDTLAAMDYKKTTGSVANTLSVTKLLNLSASRQRNVIRFWLNKLNLPLPSSIKLEHLQKDILHCRSDANPCVHWHGAEVRRYLDDIYAIVPLTPCDNMREFYWDLRQDLVIPHLGKLHISHGKNIKPVVVRFRRGGERLILPKRQGTHALSKMFQEWKVPTWQRGRIPLIYQDNKLIAVVGYGMGEGWDKKTKLELVTENKR